MPRKTLFLAAVLFVFGFLLGMPFYHIPTFTKGPLICALIGQEKNVFEIFTQPHLWTYRPLLVLMFSSLYKLFGFHYEPYRIFAATFSGFFTLFVYLFLLEVQPSRKIAFFSTLIFTLTTPYLDGLWDLSEGGFYSTCLFYGAFLFFVKIGKCDGNHKLENRYTTLFIVFSLLSLLTKEITRAMAPPVLFLYCYFMKANQKQWKLFWIFCGLSVLTLFPMLSAPPDPGSRAAVTTPFWEVAKIAFQINVTQLMSIFHHAIAPLLFLYGMLLFVIPLNKQSLPENTTPIPFLRKTLLNKVLGLIEWFLFATIVCTLCMLYFWMASTPNSITYFSAHYFPDNTFHFQNITAFIFLIAMILIFSYGKKNEKFCSTAIVFTFISYYLEMTLITSFRLEPSSRHYLLILPLLCVLITQSFVTWKSLAKLIAVPLSLLFILHLIFSAYELKSEFKAIGQSEFAAWTFLKNQDLKDTVVFSPADGYALPPEYLKLASRDKHYVFFQLPRWFFSSEEFEAYLRHVIEENNLKHAKKIFYYSGYDPIITYPGDSGDIGHIWMENLRISYDIYNEIGYWQHIFSMHGVFPSHLKDYLSINNLRLIYEKKRVLNSIFTEDPFTPFSRKYITRIYIQDP